MQINVSQLLQAPIGATRDYQIDELVDMAIDGNARLVQGNIRLTRTSRSILVKGALLAEVELTCSRCLRPFASTLSLKFEEEFIPTIDVLSGAPLPPPEEPGAFTIDKHHIIDLTEAIRQYTVLAIPMKPLCRKDCAGICPKCGQNLNTGPCACPTHAIDPRWSKLIDSLEHSAKRR